MANFWAGTIPAGTTKNATFDDGGRAQPFPHNNFSLRTGLILISCTARGLEKVALYRTRSILFDGFAYARPQQFVDLSRICTRR